MFSFVGDTVMDPFTGSATTTLAAAIWGRNGAGVEVDEDYFSYALDRTLKRGCDVAPGACSLLQA
jgi:site-specific DNA-methyltransferase (adenine-specific)